MALLYHRPKDHVTYLRECLQRMRDSGTQEVTWDTFLPDNCHNKKIFANRLVLPDIHGNITNA